MKRLFNFVSNAVAMSAAILVSCQKEVENAINPEEEVVKQGAIASLTFSISNNETTKTVIAEDEGKKYAAWESGDAIGYVTSKTDKGSANVTLGTPDKFTITPATGLDIDDKLYVWYPYRRDETSQASINMIIPVSQIQAGDSFDFDAMPLVAEPIEIESSMLSGDDYDGTIAFANLASLIEFKVFSSDPTYASEKVAAITFDAGSTNIAGHFNFDVSSVDFETSSSLEISGYTGKSVTTSLASPVTIGTDKASARNVYMVVAPGTYTGNIIVATDAAFYTIPISGKEFERSGFKSFGLDLGKEVATRRSLKGNFAWDLTQVSYSEESESSVIWNYGLLSMEHRRNTGKTNANNFIPPANAQSRFYAGNNIIYTPATSSWTIDKVEVTATTEGYASSFAGGTWVNAISSSSDVIASLSPNNSTSEFKNTSLSNQVRATEVKVYFDNTNYTVSKAAVSNGTLDVDKSTAKVNEVITVTATPNTGYALSGISVKDESDNAIAVDGTTFRMPASDVTVSATFTSSSSAKAINIPANSHGTITTEPGNSATSGTEVTITVTPNDGYALFSLSVVDEDSTPVAVTNNTFTMPNKEVTITAVFYPYVSWTAFTNSLGSKIDGVNNTANGTINLTGFGGTPSYEWSYTRTLEQLATGKADHISMSGEYMQLGSNNALESIVFTTSNMSSKKIKKIIVDAYCNGGTTHKISATVGSTSYIAETNLTSSGTEYTGTGDTKGNITINLATRGTTKKALYVKSIMILYNDSE